MKDIRILETGAEKRTHINKKRMTLEQRKHFEKKIVKKIRKISCQ